MKLPYGIQVIPIIFRTLNKYWIDFLQFLRLTEGIIGNIGPNHDASTTEVDDKLTNWAEGKHCKLY
jgi:hypothetical protein